MAGLESQIARHCAFCRKQGEFIREQLATKPREVAAKRPLEKMLRSVDRLTQTVRTRLGAIQTMDLWHVVMLVTCVEAYLHDLLTAAASVDPELMSDSDQRARYSDIIAATSLEAVAHELRARWARNRLNDGGPTRWIERFQNMGARGYPQDLAPRLEPIWGIRHVVVHAAGVATADFVKRHPRFGKAAGDRLQLRTRNLREFTAAVVEFVDPTEEFFLARYPSMRADA